MPRATELGRVANAALRSARICSRTPSSFVSAYPSSRQLSPVSVLSSLQRLSLNCAQKRHQSAWTSPARSAKQDYADDSDITKPKASSPRPWRSTATPEIPDPSSTKPEPAFDEEDIVRDTMFSIGDLSSSRTSFDEMTQVTAKYPEFRCIPRTGRTIHVGKGSDAARSFKLLNMQCTANKVRAEFQRQKFHERPGLRRKRLKSQRWQRKFKQGFKATCKRVDELRRQGW